MTYFVVGNDEDGAFVREYETVSELYQWLGSVTGEPRDKVDLSELDEGSYYRFDIPTYDTDWRTFGIVEGSSREIKPRELVTEIELE